ncbi:hypothetical protein PRIPAC_72911 [Pristionchus pacificus]|uniref:ShK domain-containing protein n=1 Tax=Pristionchus pacificus TaxID=54126 RepID=A0A2A6C8C4_PRIPA|nr:hypothetical protein PRIPAC_72911 [Pristionchus pacificus]|eukprot:PDM74409.1 ShK domain-containing protein [Pristionchus pacificus]
MIWAIFLLSLLPGNWAICGAGIAPCGDDAIIACDAGWVCDPSPFDDPPFTGCCIEAPNPNNNNPVDPSDPNNPAGGQTNPSVIRTTNPVVTLHPAVVASCRNTISDAECEHNRNLCRNQYYRQLMAEQCAATCGCGGLLYIIGTTAHQAAAPVALTTTARPTTGHSSALPHSGCYDLVNSSTGVSDCPNFSYLCSDNVYYNFMTQQCAKTCGR